MTIPKITYRQYGGKSTLSKWIVNHFPEHRTYLEPFCGSCSVLFAKPKSFIEIVNDIDHRIINMFEMIRSEPEKLAALLWATPYSAANWREHKDSEDKMEDARLLMAQGTQFYCGNGKTSTWSIDKSGCPHKPKSEVWADWFLRVAPAANRLRNVQILHEDAIIAVKRVFSQPEALVYCDPPYVGHEKEYRHSVDYSELVAVLNEAKCKVVVSEYRTADPFWKNWRSVEKTTTGTCRTGAHNMVAKKKTEVLYFNF